MLPASSRNATGRALAVTGLLLAGLFLLIELAPAQTKDKAKDLGVEKESFDRQAEEF